MIPFLCHKISLIKKIPYLIQKWFSYSHECNSLAFSSTKSRITSNASCVLATEKNQICYIKPRTSVSINKHICQHILTGTVLDL